MAKKRRRSRASQKFLILILAVLTTAGLVFYIRKGGGTGVNESTTAGVVISEVMTSNKGAVADDNGEYPDWIEIHNQGQDAVNIGGFGLSDDLTTAAKWTFPANTVLQPDGYALVFCGGDATKGKMHAGFKLSSSDDVILSSVAGKVIDSAKLRAVASGSTLSRDPTNPDNWIESRPSPGFPNTEEGVNAYLAAITADSGEDIGVYINEFMASNASTIVGPDGAYCDWIELYNTTGGDVDLSGFGISDDPAQPTKYKLPDGTKIGANSVLLIYCTGRETQQPDKIEAPFGLAAYSEAAVFATPKGKLLDSYEYTRMQTDMSFARVPDGTGEFSICAQPTPGFPNTNEGLKAFSATLTYGTGDLVLSEAMNANYSYLKQPDQQYYDWIELHNTSGAGINLSGYALSNNAKNPAKWAFPAVTIDPGEYLVVMASGKNLTDAQKKNDLATNFRLSGDGDIILLYSPEGEILDKLLLGSGHADVSYGRTGAQLLYYDKPTPGAANSGGLAGYAETPKFDLAAGVYQGAQTVSIEQQPGSAITYTLDGTDPVRSSTAYQGPITLSKTSVLRARAFTDGLYGSDSADATYIIETGASSVQDHKLTLPVMSLITDPDNLWDPEKGIYVLGNKYATATGEDATGTTMEGLMNHPSSTLANFWQGWERPVHFDLIGEDGKLEYAQDAVLRIFGAYSRAKEQKPFAIIGRPGYGPSTLNYAFFKNRPYTWYKSVIMRPSAQDNTFSRIRDIVITSLFEDGGDYGLPPESRIHIQAYRQMVLYLNGKYWGVYNMREKITSNFLAQHYGLANPDAIDILMGNGNEKCVIAGDGWRDYTDMVEWADTHDLSDPQNYAYICSMIDEKNLALYTAAEIIVGNTDTGNIKYWRTEETDNKWRWLFYDFCWAMNRDDKNSDAYSSGYRRDFFTKYFDPEGHGAGKATSTKLIRALFKNPTWRQELLNYCAYLFNNVYTTDKIIARVDECQARIKDEMYYDVDLWNEITFDSWQQHCENIRLYARNYPNYYLKYAQKFFSLSDKEMMSVFGQVTTLPKGE